MNSERMCQSHQGQLDEQGRSILHPKHYIYDGVLKLRQTPDIKVDPTKIMDNKVPNGICMLHRAFVAIKSGKEPGVLACDKFTGGLVCPEHVLENR